MSLFKKILGSKNKDESKESLSLGQEKVGIPQKEIVEAMIMAVESQNWADFDKSKIKYYMERMLFSHLMNLLQKALSVSQLEKLDTNKVRVINLLLLRDHYRHNADIIRPKTTDNWVDPLFNKLFLQFNISDSYITGFEAKFDLDTFNADWAVKISEPLGLESHKLFLTHASIVTGAREES